jgi:hypothetical protein
MNEADQHLACRRPERSKQRLAPLDDLVYFGARARSLQLEPQRDKLVFELVHSVILGQLPALLPPRA